MAFHRVTYKQTCIVCRKNKVLISSYKQKPICSSCGMRDFAEVKEEPFKTLFNIPLELYMEVPFLRSIRSNYHKFGSLSEKQIETFKRVAKEAKDKKMTEKAQPARAFEFPVPDEHPFAPIPRSKRGRSGKKEKPKKTV